MGCFSSCHSGSGDLRMSDSSLNREALGETPGYEQNIGDFNVENIEYADHGHSDDWNDRQDGGWNENKDIEINTDWGGGGGTSQEYDSAQDV